MFKDRKREITVDVTNRTMIRGILLIAAAVVLFRFIGEAAHVLTLIFIAFFLSLALNPTVGWIRRRLKIASRARATAVAYLTVVVVLAGFLTLTIPPIVNQTRDFISDAPRIVADFQQQDSSLARLADRYNINQRLSDAASSISSNYGDFGRTVLDTTKRIGSGIISTIAVLFMTFMMLVEGPRWFGLIIGSLPANRRERYEKMARKMARTVSSYVLGQLILSIVAGTFALAALLIASTVLDVSVNVVALAALVAIFGLLPMIGTPIAAIIVILICLLSSLQLAIVMALYFLVYQQIENVTLQPYIQSRQTALTPLLVFIAALLGISVAGFIGAFAAIPIAACIKILLEERFGKPAQSNAGS